MVVSILVMAFALLGFSVAVAADYPDKPIRVMVPYDPGGATDFQVRIATMKAQTYIGEPIVIINKPGAGGMVGWNWIVTSAKKDGYDLFSYNLPHFIAQSIAFPDKVKYNIINFEPIGNWGNDPAALVVAKDSPFNSAKDLIEFAKKNPDKVTCSGAGLYVGHHIALLQLNKAADSKIKYIPYTGGVPALLAVINGEVKCGFNNTSDAFRSKDRLKILAIADVERDSFIPNVPTFKEAGYDVDDTSCNMRGLGAPQGTPPEILVKLGDAFVKMCNDKGVQKQLKATGCGIKIINRDDLKKVWEKREALLKDMLAGLK
ncbi:MAG: tripartite tricarboxylate transporter substrate binding protein [Deltaproteobacteria bacterium]|nr:tripartite tricarboxylate transporter substrate binding protein [Deltaproteobacteria bacterium]